MLDDVRRVLQLDLEDEVQAMSKERRRALEDASLPVEIPTAVSLAMKTTLSIPWSKLRILRRYINLNH